MARPPRRRGAPSSPVHPRVDVALAPLVERVRPRGDERGAEQRSQQQSQVHTHPHPHPPLRPEVEPRRGGEHHQLRDARLTELQKRYQICSDMAANMKIKASGTGMIARTRRFHRSNFRCMKNSATSSAFQTARKSSNASFKLGEIGSRNASPSSAAVRSARYTQIRM